MPAFPAFLIYGEAGICDSGIDDIYILRHEAVSGKTSSPGRYSIA